MGDEGTTPPSHPARPPPVLNGLYLSAHGASARTRDLDVTAGNLANAGTAGFKRDLALFAHHRADAANRIAPPPARVGRPDRRCDARRHRHRPVAGPARADRRRPQCRPRRARVPCGSATGRTSPSPATAGSRWGRPANCSPPTAGCRCWTPAARRSRSRPTRRPSRSPPTGRSPPAPADGTAVPVARLDVVLPDDPTTLIKLGGNRFTHTGGLTPRRPPRDRRSTGSPGGQRRRPDRRDPSP